MHLREEGDLPWPGLGGPAGLRLQILVGQHLPGLKAPTPTAAHGTPERHVLVTFRGRAQQAEGGMVPPKDWRGGTGELLLSRGGTGELLLSRYRGAVLQDEASSADGW